MKVSCIIPVYNGERFLAESIDSVLSQSVPPDQVIVVDDGSTDATAEIIRRYGDRVEHVSQSNQGPAVARNAGLRQASGDLIAFQDSDDIWLPDKLERQLACLRDDAEALGCVCLVRNFWEEELRAEQEAVKSTRHVEALPGYVFQALLVRRAAFAMIGDLDQNLRVAEDVDWFNRVRTAGLRIAVVEQVLVRRRYHANNLSRSIAVSASAQDAMLEVVMRNLRQKRQLARGSEDAADAQPG